MMPPVNRAMHPDTPRDRARLRPRDRSNSLTTRGAPDRIKSVKPRSWIVGCAFALFALLLAIPPGYAGELTFIHSDQYGTPVAASDASGAMLWRQGLYPYGASLTSAGPSGNPAHVSGGIGFHGKRFEPGTGLSYFGARHYSATLGRFVSIDPQPFAEDNPHSVNRYAYGNNNPYKYVDPDGHVAETVFDLISLAMSIHAYKQEPTLLNGLSLAYDGLAAAVPFLPGGIGIIRHSGKAADAVGEAAKGGKSLGVGSPTAGKPVDSATRERILARDRNPDGTWTCATCGQNTSNPANVHTGHITPRSHGGDLSNKNLRCEGAACNLSQGDRSAPKPGMTCAERGSCGVPYGRTD